MTTRTQTFFFAAALTASLFTGSTAAAQDLDGKVVRNPNDTVTYTIDLDGPPRGNYILFGGLNLAPRPLLIPSMGALYLDPYAMFQLSTVTALNAQGKGQFRFTLPAGLTDSRCICFQAIYSDRGILRLSPWISTYHSLVDIGGNNFGGSNVGLALRHRPKTKQIDGIVQGPAPKANEKKTVEIFIYRDGHQMDSFRCFVDKTGKAMIKFTYQKQLQYKDVIDIRYCGKSLKRWRHIPAAK